MQPRVKTRIKNLKRFLYPTRERPFKGIPIFRG